ncbi:MAG: hypothetical protein IIY93_02365 [Clostridia bacterium]|jgi:hypothetical protein|nr:hypothetical protein [Clostridia bacterium]MBQ1554199.1 hypothetical protein [Clostridia bacterium]
MDYQMEYAHSQSGIRTEPISALGMTFAALVGMAGTTALSASADFADVFRLAATAFPQLTAWLLAYLMYHYPNAAKGMLAPSSACPALPFYTGGQEETM